MPVSKLGAVSGANVDAFDFLTGLKPRDSCCRSDMP